MQPGPDYMSWAQGSLAEISIPSLNAIKKKSTLRLHDNWAGPVSLDPSIVIPRSRWKFSKLSCLPGGLVNEPIENQGNG